MIESSLHTSEPVALPDRSFGRQLRSVIGYALLATLMVVTTLPVFLPALLLYCAIRNGRRAAWAVLVLTVTIVTLYALAIPGTQEIHNVKWVSWAGILLSIALPSMAAVAMVERGESFGRVLMLLLAGALVGMALTELAAQALLSFSPYAHDVAQWKKMSADALAAYRANNMPPEVLRIWERAFTVSGTIIPAQMVMMVIFVFTLSLLMLGRLKAWRDWVTRRAGDDAVRVYLFRSFQLPEWVLFVFVLGGITPLVSGLLQKISVNMLVVVVFLYVLQGLAVFRSVLVTMNAGPGGTLIAWSLLIVLTFMGMSLLLLGLTGLFDPFFDFRHFKKRKDDSHESHSD
jgi:hypothetical protein